MIKTITIPLILMCSLAQAQDKTTDLTNQGKKNDPESVIHQNNQAGNSGISKDVNLPMNNQQLFHMNSVNIKYRSQCKN